jgi:hypothetical protein
MLLAEIRECGYVGAFSIFARFLSLGASHL